MITSNFLLVHVVMIMIIAGFTIVLNAVHGDSCGVWMMLPSVFISMCPGQNPGILVAVMFYLSLAVIVFLVVALQEGVQGSALY